MGLINLRFDGLVVQGSGYDESKLGDLFLRNEVRQSDYIVHNYSAVDIYVTGHVDRVTLKVPLPYRTSSLTSIQEFIIDRDGGHGTSREAQDWINEDFTYFTSKRYEFNRYTAADRLHFYYDSNASDDIADWTVVPITVEIRTGDTVETEIVNAIIAPLPKENDSLREHIPFHGSYKQGQGQKELKIPFFNNFDNINADLGTYYVNTSKSDIGLRVYGQVGTIDGDDLIVKFNTDRQGSGELDDITMYVDFDAADWPGNTSGVGPLNPWRLKLPDPAINIEVESVTTADGLQDQINFINNNVVSALNNNVQRAQEVATQANDGIVGLTFQLRDLMSRIEALENQ